MAKISFKSLFEDDVFSPIAASAEKLLERLKLVQTGFKNIAKEAQGSLKSVKLDDLEGVEKLAVNVQKADQAFKGFTTTQKEEIRIQKELNKGRKEGTKAANDLNATQKSSAKIKKELNSTTKAQIITNEKLKKQKADQIKAIKDLIIEENKEAGTIERLEAANRRLSREQKKLNLNTEKGRLSLKKINSELDKNNKKITQNSDKTKQQSRNVGNYSDSIKEAAGASGLFGGVLGVLNQVQGTLNALTKKNTVEEKVNTVSKKANAAATAKLTSAQKAMNLVTKLGSKGLKIFKIALASTGIGLLVVALGGLIAFFSRSQKGVDFLSVKMAGLGAVVDVLIDAFAAFGETLFDAFSDPKKLLDDLVVFLKELPGLVLDNIINRFKAFGLIIKAIGEGDLKAIADGFIQLGTGVEDFSTKATSALKSVSDAAEEIGDEIERELALAQQLKELTIKLTREQKLFTAEQAKGLTTIKELTLIAKDKLALDEDRLEALDKIAAIEIKLAEKQLELQGQALASSLDAISADKTRLELGAEQLQFIEDIKNGQIEAADAVQMAADFTLSSAAGEEALFEIVEKIVAQEQARQSLLDKQSTTIKRRGALEVAIATKNSKALLAESKIANQIAKDETKRLSERIAAIELIRDLTIQAAEIRLQANIINEQELTAIQIFEAQKAQAALDKINTTSQLEELDDIEEIDKAEDDAIAKAIKRKEEQNKVEAKLNEERRADNLRTATEFAEVFGDAFEEASENRLKNLDEQESQTKTNLEKQEELAAQGLENQADFERQKLAEIEVERRKVARKAQIEQEINALAIGYLNAFAARAKEDPKTAPQKALQDVATAAVLKEGAKGLAGLAVGSALDGTEDTGRVNGGGLDGKGGRLWMLHDNEAVATKGANDTYSGLVGAMNSGSVESWVLQNMSVGQNVDTKESAGPSQLEKGLTNLANEMKDVKKEIRNKPYQFIDADHLGNIVEKAISNGETNTIIHQRFRKKI